MEAAEPCISCLLSAMQSKEQRKRNFVVFCYLTIIANSQFQIDTELHVSINADVFWRNQIYMYSLTR